MKLRGFWLPFGVLLMGCLLLMGGADGKAVKKKIVVGQNGNLCQGPLIIACEKGYFKKEGLEVELLKGDYPTLAILHEGGNVKDYTWRDYPAAQLILALEKKEIDAAIIGEQLD